MGYSVISLSLCKVSDEDTGCLSIMPPSVLLVLVVLHEAGQHSSCQAP